MGSLRINLDVDTLQQELEDIDKERIDVSECSHFRLKTIPHL